MQIQLARVEEPYHFKITNQDGLTIDSDSSPEIGGQGKGFRPMELVLAGAAGCSSIDVLLILKKQKQAVEDINVIVNAERQPETPKAFTGINFHFEIKGEVEAPKLERAIELTITKYCSVIQSLNKEIKVDYTYKIEQ